MATSAEAAEDSRPAQHEHPGWWPLVAICIAVFMLLIDITVVNVALPDIQRELGATFDSLQWIIDAYALTLAAFLLTAGSLGDRLGRRLVFVVGIAIFALASLACGLSTDTTMLSSFRAVQGIGGAIMFATSLALIASTYQGRDRGTAFGIWGAVVGASVAIGPLVGGVLVTSLGWSWIFFVNLPVAALAIGMSLSRLPESKDPQAGGIDWVGLVTFSGALAALIVALIQGNDRGWTSVHILLLLGGSAFLLIVFGLWERRLDDPMFDLDLFRKPAFAGAQTTAFCLSAAVFSLFLYLSLYLQNVLGFSAFQTGLRFLPISGMSLIVAPMAGRLTNRLPFRLLISVGLGIATAGLLLQYGLDAQSDWTALLAGFLVMGTGIGSVNAPLGSLAVGVVEPRRSGMASGINSTFRQVGIATGTAAFGAIFQSQVHSTLAKDLPVDRLPAGVSIDSIASAVSAGGTRQVLANVPPQFRDTFTHAARDAYTSGLNELFLVAAAVAFAGAVLGALLLRQRDLVSSGVGAGGGH